MNQSGNQIRNKVPRVVGIDIHPDIFSACVMTGRTNAEARIEKRFKDVPIGNLESWARRHLRTGDTVLMEAGANSFEAVRVLESLELSVCVLESQQVSATASGFLDNDTIASERIARSYLTGMSKVVWVPDEETSERRELLHAYIQAKRHETRAVNELKSYLNHYHVRLGSRNPRMEKVREWVLEQREWTRCQKKLLEHLFARLVFTSEQSAALRSGIVREVLENPMMSGCLRLLGVGPISAFAILATVGDIGRFSTPQKLVNYLGLCPGLKQSGKSKNVKLGVGSRGRKDMRSLLTQGAQAVMRQKQGACALRDWGWRLYMRKGNRNVAVAAVARRMAMQLWHLLRGGCATLEEQKKSLRLKLEKLLMEIGKEMRAAMALPEKVSDCVAHIMEQIDQPVVEKI
jgi:transposase